MKKKIPTIIGAILLGSLTATAEETQPAAKAMVLPAENVEITFFNGEKKTVTVMRYDRRGIVINNKDENQDMNDLIPWLDLRKKTIERIIGQEEAFSLLTRQTFDSSSLMSAADLLKNLEDEESREAQRYLGTQMGWWESKKRGAGIEGWGDYNKHMTEIFDDLNMEKIKNTDYSEEVSLRLKFEEKGIKPKQDDGRPSHLYSFYCAAAYACLHAGMEPLSLEEIKAAYEKAGGPNYGGILSDFHLVHGLKQQAPKKLKVLHILHGHRDGTRLADEVVKHLIRNGHALRAYTKSHSGKVVIVGYKYVEGTEHKMWDGRKGRGWEEVPIKQLMYQVLDTKTEQDDGYKWVRADKVRESFSLMFE